MSTTNPLCPLTGVADTAELIGSYLTVRDLERVSHVSKETQLLFSKQLAEKALLKAVFDADPKRVKEILDKPRSRDIKSIVLTKTHIKETYISKKYEMIGCKREWTNISPLEAAAWCGDIFLVRDLLLHITPSEKQEAANQLKGMLERKDLEENGTFLAPYKALIVAYENYIRELVDLFNDEKWAEINLLWNKVWVGQRLLPTYGLQEYCDEKPFNPQPSFTEAPSRTCYLYEDPKRQLDIDAINFPNALYKGSGHGAGRPGEYGCIVSGYIIVGPQYDLAAMRQLCEVRIADLKNLILELEEPKFLEETSLTETDKVSSLRF